MALGDIVNSETGTHEKMARLPFVIVFGQSIVSYGRDVWIGLSAGSG